MKPNQEIILITGGARSGKSTYAEKIVAESPEPVVYIATAIPFDEGMKDRIKKHREQRPSHWQTIERYKDFEKLRDDPHFSKAETVLLDCLTVMITNNMIDEPVDYDLCHIDEVNRIETKIKKQVTTLLDMCKNKKLVVVTNEVGMGLVPAYRLGNYFRDISGRMNALVAQKADEVYLVVCGIPQKIK
ncbi:MAG: bifunctional adenosylcobinamide kinase/adenosylcobinamide-phosphate guanylyltransferase [Eubacteriaceae bacterium]|jgi:adenosylcobinamide kinase/adenosylcobinamide-phosphate guanylyltransferase|nr:bifunctional adenosylcobinamide kinase/adenosylcobinamide-phosphate guanylyltransferase [Eubacteriaceae bacterium]